MSGEFIVTTEGFQDVKSVSQHKSSLGTLYTVYAKIYCQYEMGF